VFGNRALRDGAVERHLVGGGMGAVTAGKASGERKVAGDCGYFGALGLGASVETAEIIERAFQGVFEGKLNNRQEDNITISKRYKADRIALHIPGIAYVSMGGIGYENPLKIQKNTNLATCET